MNTYTDHQIVFKADEDAMPVEIEVAFLTVPVRQPGGLFFPRCRVTKVYGIAGAHLLDKYVSVFVNDDGGGSVIKIITRR